MSEGRFRRASPSSRSKVAWNVRARTCNSRRRLTVFGGMKPFLRASWLSVLSIVAIPAVVFAQDTSKVGLVMSTPSTASVIWHAGETVALRAEIAFVRSTSTHEAPGGDAESTQTTVIPGFSVLFYTGRFDALRTYVSPRYTYSRARVESSSPLGSSESTGTSHSVSGSIGAEYHAASAIRRVRGTGCELHACGCAEYVVECVEPADVGRRDSLLLVESGSHVVE